MFPMGLLFEVLRFYVGHLTFIGRVTVIVSIVVDIVVPGVTPPGRGQLKKDKYSSFLGVSQKKEIVYYLTSIELYMRI